jgi:adenine/guanine phosphoribosyltransferase-like PRPP-binding protein
LPQLKGEDRARLARLLDSDSLTVAVLPLLADDLLEVERVAALITGGNGVAQAIVAANRRGVMLATVSPRDLGIGIAIHADDVCGLS